MATEPPILLLVSDRPVLSSLQFSLALEGFPVTDGSVPGSEPRTAAVLVVDQGYSGDGLSYPPRLRGRVAAARAVLIEKPLLGDELAGALRIALQPHEAA